MNPKQPRLTNDLLATALGNSSVETGWNAGQEDNNNQVVSIPLRQWNGDAGRKSLNPEPLSFTQNDQASLIRKLTVAYAVAKVLKHILGSRQTIDEDEIKRLCSTDNFTVNMSVDEFSDLGWEVKSVDMISPELTVRISSNWITSCALFDLSADGATSRNVEATVMSSWSPGTTHDSLEARFDDRTVCYLFGQFLHSLMCGGSSQSVAAKGHLNGDSECDGVSNCTIDRTPSKKICFLSLQEKSPDHIDQALLKENDEHSPQKKLSSGYRDIKSLTCSPSLCSNPFSCLSKVGSVNSTPGNIDKSIVTNLIPLREIGYPSALSQLVTNLLNCVSEFCRSDDSYRCLDEVIHDIHFLLQEPGRFLFDRYQMPSGALRLAVDRGQLYGRKEESAVLTGTFCRVALTGHSEAVCVSGFSGCGKTRLVQSVFESVDAAGGYIVVRKFDETKNQSPLFVVLSALNDLCGLIVEKHSHEELRDLYDNIKDGTNLALLSRVLPNIIRMNTSDAALHIRPFSHRVGSGLNFHMLVFAVMRLMRIISGQSRPVMIFLDDLQWADTASLDLVHAILSDAKGSNCVLFVGSYRDQDVKQGHFVFEFIRGLSAYEVPCTELQLDGLAEEDVNQMLSDMLSVIPRLCKSLSSLVFYKTRGSPFFVVEFLHSLIDRGIVSYSLRERRWCWDIDQIGQEDITDNVLQMIHDKMSFLGDDDQTALEVASCFGIEINESVVRSLSETQLYSDLPFNLDKAVENGFMEHEGSTYRFIHDKVREAAYSLIDAKDEYHHDIGMALYSTLASQNEAQDWNDTIPTSTVLAQINHGVPSLLTCEETRSCIAELNYMESVNALESSDFTSAYLYIKAAVSLLPEDTWTNKYDRSIEYFLQFAKSAYPCGYIDEAKDSLNTIIENGRGLKETWPSYFLLTKVLFLACKELSQAFETCRKLLSMLGEDIPAVDMVTNHLSSQMTKAQMLLKDSAFLNGKQVHTDDWRNVAAMQAYDLLATITFMSHPNENCYYVCRWAEYTLVNKVSCRYTPKCIVSLASILCRDLSLDARIGYKFGKQALVLLDDSYVEDVAEVFLTFYGFIGVLFEPLQACLDMHRCGYEMAMQCGENYMIRGRFAVMWLKVSTYFFHSFDSLLIPGNLTVGAFHKIFFYSQSLKTGKNLIDLKTEIETELSLATHRSQSLLAMRLRCFGETILALIGDESTCHSTLLNDKELTSTPSLMEAQCLNEMMSSTYLGNPERVHVLSKHLESSQKRIDSVAHRSIYIAFYCGLSVAATYRTKPVPQQLTKLDDSVSILAKAARFSEWNFKNKVALLKAELASVECDDYEAESQYDVSIAAARSSKFIQEEALACELAAKHCKSHDKEAKALNLFREALRCYQEWGSKVKASQIVLEIESL
ncbi:hypothetical protein ACHAW6_009888, partial [Cyclotella cf. meneghiniana]